MVSSLEHFAINVNGGTQTVPGRLKLSPTVLDCPYCVPRSFMTFVSKNYRCRTVRDVGDTSRATSHHLESLANLKEAVTE